jgi:N-acetylmuramoyl-L-alanine amidase
MLNYRMLMNGVVLLTVAACAPLPHGQGGGMLWQPSPNFDLRRPNYVILHHTTNTTAARALETLTHPDRSVSAHYLIDRNGEIIQLVDETKRAWHAGESWWGGTTDLNSSSIGIELDNTGEEAFPDIQIDALLNLLTDLRTRYRIPPANILGHADVAPSRKVDPSRFFPWQRLAQHGFGVWCAEIPGVPPIGLDSQLGLQALGYQTTVPGSTRAAFRRHFMARDDDRELDANELALLACLVRIKMEQGSPSNQAVQP